MHKPCTCVQYTCGGYLVHMCHMHNIHMQRCCHARDDADMVTYVASYVHTCITCLQALAGFTGVNTHPPCTYDIVIL